MDYIALWGQIQANPDCGPYITPSTPKVAPDIAQVNDQAIADILNSVPGGVVYSELSAAKFTTWAVITGMRAVIQDIAVDTQSPLRSSALAMIDVMQGNVPVIDFRDAGLRAVIDAWVDAGMCPAPARDALLLMCSREAGWAEYALGRSVTAADVSRAVRGPRE